ncbi:hypothetical protein QRX60_17360 [Amycolatopsis mongoliensis]|uniref:DNA-binding protein n=1 Tax=Amycolatopsis mongoliensis TaxID=715475 RepID=A0A9Y2JZ73_9PSEU|nr:hypothetical protein [Amycolatopsis sp. 4-36]WIY07385.1 hypothetical protein QRX60_17360 [Amycolatopsis sp. 4-36]
MTIYRAVDEGAFPAIRTRGRISIPAKAIDAMEAVAISEMRAVDSSEFTLPMRNGVEAGSR